MLYLSQELVLSRNVGNGIINVTKLSMYIDGTEIIVVRKSMRSGNISERTILKTDKLEEADKAFREAITSLCI